MAPPQKETLSLKLYLRSFKLYFNLPLMLSLKLSSSNCLNLDLNTHPLSLGSFWCKKFKREEAVKCSKW